MRPTKPKRDLDNLFANGGIHLLIDHQYDNSLVIQTSTSRTPTHLNVLTWRDLRANTASMVKVMSICIALSVRSSRPNKWRQRPYTEAIFTVLFYLQRNIGTHTADTFTAVQTRSSSFDTLQQITSSLLHVLPLLFYSPPRGRDLWTRVRWPMGQRAATGGKVTTPGPMNGTNAASRHVCRCTEWPPVQLSKVDRAACH